MRSLAHLREKAVELRREHNMSLDDICMRLNLPRTTVYYWIRGIPIVVTQKQKVSQKAGTAANVAKCAARRQEAYDATYTQAVELLADQDLRDFVVLYLAEGHRKDRNRIGLSNSNPQMIRFAHRCMKRMTGNPRFYYSFQDHDELKQFWASTLSIEPSLINAIPKTNSGHLKGRQFACAYGVFQIQANDTIFRAQLQALMDRVQEQWTQV